MSRFLQEHLIAWFVSLWLLLVFLWHVSFLFKGSLFSTTLLVYSVCMAVHLLCYWSDKVRMVGRVGHLLVLLGLVGSVLVMSHFSRNANIILGLYLALMMEALDLLKQTRLVAAAIGLCLVLFFLSLRVVTTGLGGLDLVPPFLFIGGYIILHAQQTSAHRHTQALLHEVEETHAVLKTTHAQVAAYALRVEELTIEAERQRLARELHDTQAQGLTGLILQLEAIDMHLGHQHYKRAREIVEQARTRARATLTDVRRAIDDLRAGGISPSDLSEAVQEEIDHCTTTTGLHCMVDLAALGMVPAPLCEYALRAITEGITNITRHAQASQAWIGTRTSENMVVIEVRDNGKGFDPGVAAKMVGHYGLLGLRERALLAQGSFDVLSAPGTGALLRFCLPRNVEKVT